jgi:hypothetical protein
MAAAFATGFAYWTIVARDETSVTPFPVAGFWIGLGVLAIAIILLLAFKAADIVYVISVSLPIGVALGFLTVLGEYTPFFLGLGHHDIGDLSGYEVAWRPWFIVSFRTVKSTGVPDPK